LTGIAPKAFLGNYKIFGSPGINDFSDTSAVIAAIDDAVLDGMDIISISFGAIAQFPYDEQGDACSDDPKVLCDPTAIAAETAAELGVVVVASAGNAGAFC
jgi:subtilisin family serine protease